MIIPIAAALGLVLLNPSIPVSKISSLRERNGPLVTTVNEFLKKINEEKAALGNETNTVYWNFVTNITDDNEQEMIDHMKVVRMKNKEIWERSQQWRLIAPFIPNTRARRQLKSLASLGASALPVEKYERLTKVEADMEKIYSTAKLCDFYNKTKCDLTLTTDISEILGKSRNVDELAYIWNEWRSKTGKQMKHLYTEMVELWNEASKLNGFRDTAQMWISRYESRTFEKEMYSIFKHLRPLYEQIHAYARRKLRETYGSIVSRNGPIPAHLLGNMWAQDWSEIYDILVPYPEKKEKDVTTTMVEQGYNPKKIFELADDFFVSMGLEKVPASFWEKSLLEKPSDGRNVVCHASAWEFSTGDDFRVKQCTQINKKDLIVAHHEMGHIQYFMLYKDQPQVFRRGANPGFHEAVGDVISLSVTTPKHLRKLRLLPVDAQDDMESDINALMKTALAKVAFLPFGYLIDRWRWDVYRGHIKPNNYTCSWWNYRSNMQGVSPPSKRTEEDFDPGAKYHVPSNTPYIRYFVSTILQFQFYESACRISGEFDPKNPNKPLHRCDLYGSKEAGKAFGDMLRLGSSVDWRIALKQFTGTSRINPRALRSYFKPLEDWLRRDNLKHKAYIGWKRDGNFCASA